MTNHEAYVAFNMVPNVGSVKLAGLIGIHGSAAAAWEAFPDKKDWQGKEVDWIAEIERAKKKNVHLIDCEDARYPSLLNQLPSKPLVLYVAGNPEVLSLPGVAIVGTRLPTLYGSDMAQSFAAGIAGKGFSVISGLASGIDACAHEGAILARGVTIGVLGGALDKFFPEENRDLGHKIISSGGAVICEYPFGFPPGKTTFPQRNRIVAAMSRAVLAIEAPMQSGTLITCNYAKKLGRRLMVLPGNINSKNSAGCWKLFKEGAELALSVNDVIDAASENANTDPVGGKSNVRYGSAEKIGQKTVLEKGPSAPLPKPDMSLEESAILKVIPSTGITLERLAFVTKLPASNVADATMTLRLKGMIRFLPGNRVAPIA
ncbi:MAG: DNA-processing protein DprA [Kiritimatiellae bacterium]|nr:DNA-processing protein DprA [Kiritimatiellia bacterium]